MSCGRSLGRGEGWVLVSCGRSLERGEGWADGTARTAGDDSTRLSASERCQLVKTPAAMLFGHDSAADDIAGRFDVDEHDWSPLAGAAGRGFDVDKAVGHGSGAGGRGWSRFCRRRFS